jgi:small-conductance mechanosensitive channel
MDSSRPDAKRSLGEVISSLLAETRHLFRQELELVKSEMKEKFTVLSSSALTIVIGGVLILLGGMALTATLALVLSLFMSPWIATLIVSLAFLLIGATIIAVALRKLQKTSLTPKRTVQTLRRGAQVMKEPLT